VPAAGVADRAHHFFSQARWQIDELGLAIARLALVTTDVSRGG